jgi:anti-sigma regulatory factor (Ser/Thr protein kinase)
MPIVKFGDRISGLRSGDVLIRALPPDDEEVVIDLSLVRFANPSGLVSLATACIESIAIGNLIAVVAPDDRSVANYLVRMRFRDLLRDEGVRFPGGFVGWDVNAQPLADRLLELQGVNAENAEDISTALVSIGGAAGIPDDVIQPAFLGLAEAVDNAIEHSRADRAFVMAQRYRSKDERLRLEIAIGDTGVGLRETLRRRYEVPDDESAVELALTKGVSARTGARRGARRGNGLSSVVDSVCRTAGGSLEIRSGTASQFYRGRVVTDPRTHEVSRDGVQIALTVPAGRGS